MKNLFKSKPERMAFYLGLVLVFVLTTIGVVAGLTVDKDAVAVVGGQKITKAELNEAIYGISFAGTKENPDGATDDQKKQTLEDLIERKIGLLEAKKLNLSVSDEEVEKSISDNLENFGSYTEEQKALTRKTTKEDLLLEKVKSESIASREGSFLVFNFHKYFATNTDGYKVVGQGDAALMEKQKTAAKALADKVIKDYRDGKINFTQAKATLLADPEVGQEAMRPRTPNMWGNFNAKDYQLNDYPFLKTEMKQAVSNLKEGEVSEPVVDKGTFVNEDKEYRYLVFFVTKLKSGDYNSQEDWIAAKKKEYLSYTAKELVNSIIAPKTALAADNYSGCNRCDVDNADLEVALYYLPSSSTTSRPLPRGFQFSIQGGGSGDPALAKDGSSFNVGCLKSGLSSEKTLTSSGTTAPATLCGIGYSYFCQTSNLAYIKLPSVPDTIVPNSIKDSGHWRWDNPRTAESSSHPGLHNYADGNSTYSGHGAAMATLHLNPEDNPEGITYNAHRVKNYFTWYPAYKTSTPSLSAQLCVKKPGIATTACNGNDFLAQPGETVELWQKITNNSPTPASDIFIRNNIADDGNTDNASANGTRLNPFSVTEAAVANATAAKAYYDGALVETQLPGNYDPANPNALQWAFHTIAGKNGIPATLNQGHSYAVMFTVKVNNDENLRGKYIGNKMGAAEKADMVGKVYSSQAHIRISPPNTLTCNVKPKSGTSPLTVEVNAISNLTTGFNYDMGDGNKLENRGTDVFYTYSPNVNNQYRIKVSNKDYLGGKMQNCDPVVSVTVPSSGSGGEVAP